MADPTPAELQSQIDELRTAIMTEYQPPSGTEYSYPIVGQPMNDEMWQYVTLGIGSGVLDEGGQPYWLRDRENANNTLRITTSTTTNTAQAALRGFYHKMIQDKLFTVPGVTANTLFHFCLTYNPVGLNEEAGPISLQMYAGTPPTTQGRHHILLWTLLRKPNQLLTDAEVRMIRPKITPTIAVNSESDRPDPSKVLWGTRVYCHTTGIEYYATGASEETGGPTRWQKVGLVRDWTPLGLGSGYEAQGVAPAYKVEGGYVEFRGTVRRSNGSALSTSEYVVFGWAPGLELADFNFMGNGTSGKPVSVTTVTSPSNGIRDNLRHRASMTGTYWFSLDGMRVPLK